MGLIVNTDNPQSDIFEVALIGTGGGYGESVVVHLGDNNWIVIDSCIDPHTKTCLPLEYLKSINVDIANDVKLIICSHWHDDHILGISELLSECTSSKFCMARTTDTRKFLQLVGLDYYKSKSEPSASSTAEIAKCIKIIDNRNISITTAEQDRLLLNTKTNKINSKVYALSPSDFIINEFDKEISSLITNYGTSNRKITIQTPNAKSVALYIAINNHSILLGSDLEVSSDNNKGWLCILDNCQCISGKSSLFKIPHHGSLNGYHERIWNDLLHPNVTASLTPWNYNNKLPKQSMLDVFLNHTDNLFITSLDNFSNSAKKRDKSISKAINKFNSSLYEVKYKYGVIRCRLNILDDNSKWNTELFGEAKKIAPNMKVEK